MTTLTLHTAPRRPATRSATRSVTRTAPRPGDLPAGRSGRQARPTLRSVPVAAPAGPGATDAPAPLRLTARGRLVARSAAVLLGLALALVAVLAGGRVANADADSRPLTVEHHVVRPGETLWQIAGETAPGADRRDTVARIVELNALGTSELQAGQRIAVPAQP